MELFNILRMYDDKALAKDCKLHLARDNGVDNPLDLYRADTFEDWQRWQTKANFGRPLVVALIQHSRNRWLFAGVYGVDGRTFVKKADQYRYDMTLRPQAAPLSGRLIVQFKRPGRQSYLNAERWAPDLIVSELYAERIRVVDFSGYTNTRLSKTQLDVIVTHAHPSWKSALSSVAGVYVISDTKSGRLYVGSATGTRGIWGRWCEYSSTGHGGNRDLRQLLKERGQDYANNFQFGVLETADTRASDDDVRARETHWKELLLSRTHGYNAN